DFVPMVKGRGSMALAGPYLTKAVTGEDVTQEELGGSKVHTRISGVGDLEVESDEECIAAIKDYLSFFPQNCEEAPPLRQPVTDPVERMDEELLDVLPDSPRKPYDMYDLIVAWPSAEISVMGPEGAVNIIFRKQIEASEDPDATRAQMIEGIRKSIDPYIAAGNAMIDDVIDPRETRPTVVRALEMAQTK